MYILPMFFGACGQVKEIESDGRGHLMADRDPSSQITKESGICQNQRFWWKMIIG